MYNVTTYNPTYLKISNLSGGYAYVFDQYNLLRYYITNDILLELPYDSELTWKCNISKYGTSLSSFEILIDKNVENTVYVDVSYTLDDYVSSNVQTVSSYTTFQTTQQIYDYLSYYVTTSAGSLFNNLKEISPNALDLGNKNLILHDAATVPFEYDSNTIIIKSNMLSGEDIVTTGNITLSGNSMVSFIGLCCLNVYQDKPKSLTGVYINGNLYYNTPTNTSIIYKDCIINYLYNTDTGIISLSTVNSDIINKLDNNILVYNPILNKYVNNIHDVRIYGYNNDYKLNKTLDLNTTFNETQISSISTINNLDNLYDAASYWTIKNALSTNYFDLFYINDTYLDFMSNDIVIDSSRSTAFSYASSLSTVIIKTSNLSANSKFKGIKTSGSLFLSSGNISNINVYCNVYKDQPTDLSGVNVTGTFTYNTSSIQIVTYYNSNVDYIDNMNENGNVIVRSLSSVVYSN
jgi:hypothetical protein